jgi:uncharacterized protein (TIGR02996 family)
MPTFTNDRSGRTVTTDFSNEEAARIFAEAHGGDDRHWLWYWLHTYALEHSRCREARTAPSQAQPVPAGTQADRTPMDAALEYLGDSFIVAIGMGLKRPMVRLHYRGRRFKFYLSRRGTLCLKSGGLAPITVKNSAGEEVEARFHAPNPSHPEGCRGCTTDPARVGRTAYSRDPVGDEEYVGCLLRGRFYQARAPQQVQSWYGRRRFNPAAEQEARENDARPLRPLHEDEAEFLTRLAADPVRFLAECSKDLGRCCYCNQPLDDPRSKQVGYGQTCAHRWGLPWGDPAYTEKAPSFASEYDSDAAGLCRAIRSNPYDDATWMVFADWLEEHRLPRCKTPEKGVVLPRND